MIKNGNVVVQYDYEDVTELNEYGFAGIKKDGKWGAIDSNGNQIVEPIYEINENTLDINFIGKYYRKTFSYKRFYYTDSIE